MDTVQDIPEATVETVVKRGPGRPPKIHTDSNPPTSGHIEPVMLEGKSILSRETREENLAKALEETFGQVIDIDSNENMTFGYQTLGKFAPPPEFDMEKYSATYGIETAGAMDGWQSVSQLEQPTPFPAIRKILPAWKVWRDKDGNPFKVDLGKTKAVLMYQPKENLEIIKKAEGALSTQNLKGIEAKIQSFNQNLPSAVEDAFKREEEQLHAAIQASYSQQ